uniref:Sorting nexin-29 n=1 Tax=Sphaerodactylus townsendi TaxID=933632 RepID=A0ACB8FLB0_9SAUR
MLLMVLLVLACLPELRQAIVAMMARKHELEEQSRSLRNLLDGEMEHSAGLRQEIDNLKRKASEQDERYAAKIQALARSAASLNAAANGCKDLQQNLKEQKGSRALDYIVSSGVEHTIQT